MPPTPCARTSTVHGCAASGLSVALALSQTLLEHSGGAWRMQGGGFAGTIQAFVPQRLVQTYHDVMEGVFGKGSCYILRLREQGAIRVI